MYIQPEAIMSQYDISVEEIQKGRGTYICRTKEKELVLLPFKGSKERAEFIEVVLQYLKSQGMDVEQLYRTTENELLSSDELEGKYLLKDLRRGTECNIKNRKDIKDTIVELARMHKLLEKCPKPVPHFLRQERDQTILIYEKHLRELVKVKNYIKNKKKRNEFEQIFQKQYENMIRQAKESVRLLKESKEEHLGLCHGSFNQHNVLRVEQGMVIVQLQSICYGLYVSDFVNFFRKTMEKNDWDEELGMQMLEWYQQIEPISRADYKQVYTLLLFPEKFWKIVNHYYNSHKAWLSERDIEKLKKVIAQEEARSAFLEKLFSFTL